MANKKGPKRILGTAIYHKVAQSEVFDRVVYAGFREGQPGEYFGVERGEYNAFIRWHGLPVESGYGERPSRISLLTVNKGRKHLMWWEPNYRFPQVKKLSEEDAKDPDLKVFLDDIVEQFNITDLKRSAA